MAEPWTAKGGTVKVLRLLKREPAYWVASCDGVIAITFMGDAEREHVDAVEQQILACRSQNQNGIAILFVIGEGSPIPKSPVRRRATEFFGGLRPDVKVFAPVIMGKGFVAAAKRSVLTMLVSGMGAVYGKVFGQPADACDWLAKQCKEHGIVCPAWVDLAEDVAELGWE